MRLRPDSWVQIVDSGNERAAAALAGMIALAEIARDESDLDRAAIDALTDEAPALVANSPACTVANQPTINYRYSVSSRE